MARNLGNVEDVKKTKASMEQQGSNMYLSIPDTKTPWYLLGLDYIDFFCHWYDGPQGGTRAVVCAGGSEGSGFDTENCPICAYVLELYQEAKRLREEEQDEARAKVLKDKANRLRGKPQIVLKAIRGQYLLVKDEKTGKKVREAYFQLDPEDEDSSVAVGLLSLSEAQWSGLTGMINGEATPFITSGDDLGNRVLFTKKERRSGKKTKYTAVVWGAESEETEMPEVEIPEELANLNLDSLGEIDHEEVSKVAAYLSGQSLEVPEEDEEVEMEDDSSEEDEPDDSYLDDMEDDEEEASEEEDLDEDDFEDDIPYDEEEEEEIVEEEVKKKTPPKKTTTKRATTSKSTAKKPTSTAGQKKSTGSTSRRKATGTAAKKTTGTTARKKSGKTRM